MRVIPRVSTVLKRGVSRRGCSNLKLNEKLGRHAGDEQKVSLAVRNVCYPDQSRERERKRHCGVRHRVSCGKIKNRPARRDCGRVVHGTIKPPRGAGRIRIEKRKCTMLDYG